VSTSRAVRAGWRLALGIAWAGRLLALVFTVLCTVVAAYLTVWAWRLQPVVPSDMDAEYTAGIAVALGLVGAAFSAMATAARALPPWWLGFPC
jgi:hypothetical protein